MLRYRTGIARNDTGQWGRRATAKGGLRNRMVGPRSPSTTLKDTWSPHQVVHNVLAQFVIVLAGPACRTDPCWIIFSYKHLMIHIAQVSPCNTRSLFPHGLRIALHVVPLVFWSTPTQIQTKPWGRGEVENHSTYNIDQKSLP